MKTPLLKTYFNGDVFMAQIIVAAFREKERWRSYDLMLLVAWVAEKLQAPPMKSIQDFVVRMVDSGLLVRDSQGGDLFLMPGKTSGGVDIRKAGKVEREVTALIKPGIEYLKRFAKVPEVQV